MELTAFDFSRGFVSALALSGERVIEPRSSATRCGFRSLIAQLEQELERQRACDHEWYMAILRLRNRIQAGNNGTFDAFIRELRRLQLSLVGFPNPDYEQLTFDVSNTYADHVLNAELDERTQKLVRDAANAYLTAKQKAAVS